MHTCKLSFAHFFKIDIFRQTENVALLKQFSIIRFRTWITADPVRHARAPALFTARLPANVTRLRAIVLLETDFRLQCTHVAAEWSAAQPRSDTLSQASRSARQTLKSYEQIQGHILVDWFE